MIPARRSPRCRLTRYTSAIQRRHLLTAQAGCIYGSIYALSCLKHKGSVQKRRFVHQENRSTSSSFPKMALEIFQTVSISAQRLSRLPSAVICTLKNSKHVWTLLGLQADYFQSYLIVCFFVLGFWIFGCLAYLH